MANEKHDCFFVRAVNEKHDCFFDRALLDDATDTVEQICVHPIKRTDIHPMNRYLPVDLAFCKSCPFYVTYDEMFDRLKAERGDDCLGE